MPRWDCLSVGLAVADHLCEPIDRLPAAGELVVSERLNLLVGGCAANAAVDLARLGARVGLVARVGNDVFGRHVCDTLAAEGVDTSTVAVSEASQTSGTLIINVKGEDRRFIHSFGANAEFDGSEVTLELLQSARVLYLGGYFAMPSLSPSRLAGLFRQARELGVRTVLDVVVPGPADHAAALQEILPCTDIFLPNTDESRIMSGLTDPADQARQFHAWGAGTVVVTCGSAGAVAVSGTEAWRVPAFSVPFVDGTGSGDAFDAGFILGMLEGLPLPECVAYGSALGASCVQQTGATTGVFTRPELLEFLRSRRLVPEPL